MDSSYHEFKQRVRRHRPSDVLRRAAKASILNESTRNQQSMPPLCLDFAIAAVCKAALCFGNEHRASGVSLEDLREMCSALIAVRDPFLDDNRVDSFTVRMAFEQLPYQTGMFEELARTRALLVDAASEANQHVITPEYWKSLLGCSIDEFVALAILMHTGAMRNEGLFRSSWLKQAQFEAVYKHLDRSVIEEGAYAHFIISLDRFRSLATEHELEDPSLKRYEFNPLLVGPFVELPGRDPIAPVLHPILYRATPGSLYYTAVAEDGREFTEALGKVFEHYVGKQLALCEPEELLPEIVYDKDSKRSVDHIVVLPKAVALVEAKATPLSQGARLGKDKLEADFARAPGKAVDQIERTATLIKNAHPSFAHIPRDRPVVGLIVTMEPYHLCANDLVFSKHTHAVPTWLCSARDLEQLVAMGPSSCEEQLLDSESGLDRNGWSLSARLSKLKTRKNPILQPAWDRYSFGPD